MSQDRSFVWKIHQKQLEWVHKLVGRGLRNQQHRRNTDSQVYGNSDLPPTCRLCQGRAQERNNGLCQHSVWKLPSSSCSDGRQFNSFLDVPGAFQLLPPHRSSERVSGRKSVLGPVKRNCLGIQEPSVSLSNKPHWFSQPEVMGTGSLGSGPSLGLGPLAPRWGPLQPKSPS